MNRYQRPEQPKPIGTIIGVVVAFAFVLVFMLLMATGVISPKRKEAQTPAAPTLGVGPAYRPGQPGVSPSNPTGVATPGAPGQGVVRFSGRFDEKANTRKVETLCPSCGKPVESGIERCPLCSAGIKWPEKVKCGHCSMDKPGACGVCGGTGNCPFCSKGPRMLMGVRPPCDACNRSGKCPACEGDGKCGFCVDGIYTPGKTPPPKPPKKLEPPPPEVKPEAPPAETKPETPAPAPAPAPAA
jgi:hypothetical protein